MGAHGERDFFILINYWQYGIEGFKEVHITVMFEVFKEGGSIIVVFQDTAQDWEKIASADAERCERQNVRKYLK